MANKEKQNDHKIVRPHLVATVGEKGKVKPIVIDLDPPIHTAKNPRCSDSTCPCHTEKTR